MTVQVLVGGGGESATWPKLFPVAWWARRQGGREYVWRWRDCEGNYWAGDPPPPGPLCRIPGHCLIHATTKDHSPWT